MELKEFQLNAVKSLFEAMDKPVRDIILKSPTGSGKTIILTYFMHQYIQSYPKTVFVWLTPGKGNLEEQSKAKMDKYIHASQTKLLSDVMTAGFEENDSCFINWEKLTKKGNNALKDSERTNFLEHIEHALNDGLRFIIIVDESHQNNTIKADEIIQYFRTEKIIRCSATPKGIAKAEVIEIPEEEVIAAGLIKKMLVINQDFPQTVETEDQTAYLLERALQKQRELRAAYLQMDVDVNPLIIVQIPNKSETLLDGVERWFEAQGLTYENSQLAVWLSDRHENLEGIDAPAAPSTALFKNKSWLNIDLILFDEAQLSDEKSVRGLYFDSIVRRALKSFPDAKYVFAHPFISNPEAQLERNGIIDTQSAAINYEQKNVGQIFYVHNPATGDFYHLGTSKEILGKQKLKAEFDPIERAISSGGSVLIYVSKSHIYNKSIYSEFDKYIKLCNKLEKPDALQMIDELRSYIGASKNNALFYNSEMLEKLSLGIVTHHGSMPLAARLILEHFTQSGFCRICFATSTLEQGINMPFDVVYLDKFEASKSLSVKNLIGRAGRSTVDAKFDYGSVVIRNNAITSLRRVMRKAEPLSKISNLDVTDDSLDEKYKEFKEAINTGAFSDEYNLPSADVEKLHSDDVTAMIPQLLDMMFDDGDIISPNTDMKEVNDLFSKLYQQYLGRKLCQAEKSVLSTAVKIMIWKIYGKTFHRICQYRYAYASRTAERQQLYRKRNAEEANSIPAKYIVGYHDIPDKDLTAYPLVSTSIAAKDVDYDLIVYDTYDYLDKLIGFKLSDIFYAIFYQYYEATSDERALRLAKYFKYGTDKEREIWMLRYGFSFEEIEWVSECVDSIDETEIKFNDKINALDDAQLKSIEQYVHE